MKQTLYRAATELETSAQGRTIHGLAIPYGVETEIHERGGSYTESFEPGAFARSISERSHKIRLFVGHDRRKLAIGVATELTETLRGLEVAFHVPDTTAGNDALEAVRSDLVDGFSVGFVPIRNREVHRENKIVRIEASLREVSLTDVPCYPTAAIAGVRSANTISPEQMAMRLRLLDIPR
ncbi:HK97 family phage prohead protease [Rhodococcoides yunnanense]|uniref:HK97 family phage prohead protease n=1 Tax=Rhodococcoides yunnanense TaxID=278209 RepID=UPI000933D1C4|nr:HK97 family phage prohead protease [Rhodococcus yunnanensis]